VEPFDLDAVSAKAEATGDGPRFTFRGTEFSCLPISEFRYTTLELLDSNLREGLTELLGPQAEKFWAFQPMVLEVITLKEELVARYGGALAGESAASRASSKKSSGRSRQPSPGTTTKISA
jgi:hypothetical protein